MDAAPLLLVPYAIQPGGGVRVPEHVVRTIAPRGLAEVLDSEASLKLRVRELEEIIRQGAARAGLSLDEFIAKTSWVH